MTGWTSRQLDTIATADDFRTAPFRGDGVTPGTLIWVWAVHVADAIFVRSENPESRWFAAAIRQRAGIASFGDFSGPVVFTHVTDGPTKDLVDAAYTAKYGDDPYFSAGLLARSREQIARVLPIRPTDRS
ncbi:DUF2255 family protein [Streptomyces mirabilis]|jgi:hypothetical protein|uniref:DUF2255 family protein n=1 Tax=Streptomyces mirabilis TaxID=68239 RepID=UPI0007661761|nr:DUF2255 family protein [Streptomyces mirabilis]MCX4428827.1 DUF2255 family protein [Streptomyces mirabilis]